MKTNFVVFVANNPIIVLTPYYWNKAGDRSSRVPLVKKIKKSRILEIWQNLNKDRHLKHQSRIFIATYVYMSSVLFRTFSRQWHFNSRFKNYVENSNFLFLWLQYQRERSRLYVFFYYPGRGQNIQFHYIFVRKGETLYWHLIKPINLRWLFDEIVIFTNNRNGTQNTAQ